MDDVSTLIITYQPQPRMFSDLSGQTKNTAGRYGLGALPGGVGGYIVLESELDVCDLGRSSAISEGRRRSRHLLKLSDF